METGKTGKYLKYAIGEILLVVIGILIALQINNWNEARKARKVEQQYLLALQDEFEKNLIEVNRVISLCDSVFSASKKVINKKDQNGQSLSDFEIQTANMNAFRFPPKFIQSPGILNDLINSGYLSKLNNIQLRSQIQKWFVTIQQVKDEEDEFWHHREKVIDLMQREFSFRNYMIEMNEDLIGALSPKDTSKETTAFFHDDDFDNLLLFYTIVLRSLQLEHYPNLKNNIESILNEIDKSID